MEEDIQRQINAFRYFGIDEEATYSESVDELIKMHHLLLKEKFQNEKQKFRQNLINIVKVPN